jgi:hypothetical protein
MVDPHAAQAALRSSTGVCGYDAHRCSTRGKAQSCRPVSSPVDCDSLRPPASHHASHPDRHLHTHGRRPRSPHGVGPRDRTVSLPPSHNCELVWRGPLRRRRSIYSQYVLSHTIFIGVQSVSFVAVPPRAAAHLTASAPLHRAPRLKGRLQHRRPGKPMTAVTALHCRHSGLHVQAARPTSNVTRGRQRRAAPPPARRAAPLRTRSTSSRHDLRITIPATRRSRDAACT